MSALIPLLSQTTKGRGAYGSFSSEKKEEAQVKQTASKAAAAVGSIKSTLGGALSALKGKITPHKMEFKQIDEIKEALNNS